MKLKLNQMSWVFLHCIWRPRNSAVLKMSWHWKKLTDFSHKLRFLTCLERIISGKTELLCPTANAGRWARLYMFILLAARDPHIPRRTFRLTAWPRTLLSLQLQDKQVSSFPGCFSWAPVEVTHPVPHWHNTLHLLNGFPGGASGKEPTCHCRRHRDSGSIPGLGRSPGGRAWQPTPVFLPGEFQGQRSLVGYGP